MTPHFLLPHLRALASRAASPQPVVPAKHLNAPIAYTVWNLADAAFVGTEGERLQAPSAALPPLP